MNDIIKVFSKNNIKILRELDRSEGLYIREIAEKIGCSAGAVHRAIKLFEKFGLVKEKTVKNRKVMSLNRENLILKMIKSLLNVNALVNSKALKELKKYGDIGVYGSFVKGEDLPESDIDLWVTTEEKDAVKLRTIVREMEKELGKEVKLLVLSKAKLNAIKKDDPEFYQRLKLTSIVLNGDIID